MRSATLYAKAGYWMEEASTVWHTNQRENTAFRTIVSFVASTFTADKTETENRKELE
jgi:hypothetical protein